MANVANVAVVVGLALLTFVMPTAHSGAKHLPLAVGAVLMIVIADPLAGTATGPPWLPSPRGAIGQPFPAARRRHGLHRNGPGPRRIGHR